MLGSEPESKQTSDSNNALRSIAYWVAAGMPKTSATELVILLQRFRRGCSGFYLRVPPLAVRSVVTFLLTWHCFFYLDGTPAEWAPGWRSVAT